MIGPRTLVLAAVGASALTASASATTVSKAACTKAQQDMTLQLTTYGYPYASQCQDGTGWMFYPSYQMPTKAQWSKICKAESCGMLAWLTKSSTANCVLEGQFNLYTYVDAYEKKCNRTVTNDPKSVGFKG